MILNRVRFGDYIKLIKEKCKVSNLTPNDVSGINREKEFFEPSRQVGSDTFDYKIVPPNCFACNTMHVGRDAVLPIALNTTDSNKVVSPAYIVFDWLGEKVLLKKYLFMMLKSKEMDRYFWFHCDSSVRDGMDWDAFCDIELEVPPIEIQRKYVAIYDGMLANLRSYEKGLKDLEFSCESHLENLKKTVKCEEIGNFLELKRNKNTDDNVKEVYGVSNTLKFIPASSTVDKNNLTSYKIVNYEDIAYVPTTHMKIWAVAISEHKQPFVVSPIYEVFGVKNKDKLCPEYLFLWLCRKETIRYAYYNSWGSARENFVYDDLCTIKMPIPDIDIQRSVASIYQSYCKRKKIYDELKERITNICPILIRGSIFENQGVN